MLADEACATESRCCVANALRLSGGRKSNLPDAISSISSYSVCLYWWLVQLGCERRASFSPAQASKTPSSSPCFHGIAHLTRGVRVRSPRPRMYTIAITSTCSRGMSKHPRLSVSMRSPSLGEKRDQSTFAAVPVVPQSLLKPGVGRNRGTDDTPRGHHPTHVRARGSVLSSARPEQGKLLPKPGARRSGWAVEPDQRANPPAWPPSIPRRHRL